MAQRIIHVVLIDDCAIILDAFQLLLTEFPSIKLEGSAQSADDAIGLFQNTRAEIAIIDLLLPGASGFELALEAKRFRPRLKIIFFSALHSRAHVEAARQLGAAAYVVKDSMELLGNVIINVSAGCEFIGPGEARPPTVFPYLSAPTLPLNGKEALSPREIEILQLWVSGLEVKEMAERLELSPRTVEVHRQHIIQKTQTRSPAVLTKIALTHGWTEL